MYGLRWSGVIQHEQFSDNLRDIDFSPCRAEPDIWTRHSNGLWEYIAVYVDDLAFAVRDPKAIVTVLKIKYN